MVGFVLVPLLLAITLASPAFAQDAACGPTWTVSIGDTLTNIALRCGITPQALLSANPQITDPDVLPLGTALTIPGGVPRVDPVPETPQPSVGALVVVGVGPPLDGRVRLFARDLPAGARVLVGSGETAATAIFFEKALVDPTGVLSVELTVPPWAARGPRTVFVVEVPIGGGRIASPPYDVVSGRSD